jgi:hypothetical protein
MVYVTWSKLQINLHIKNSGMYILSIFPYRLCSALDWILGEHSRQRSTSSQRPVECHQCARVSVCTVWTPRPARNTAAHNHKVPSWNVNVQPLVWGCYQFAFILTVITKVPFNILVYSYSQKCTVLQ